MSGISSISDGAAIGRAFFCLSLTFALWLAGVALPCAHATENTVDGAAFREDNSIVGILYFHLPMGVTDPELLEHVRVLQEKIEIRSGMPYKLEDVQEAIRILYYRNLFAQIRVYGEYRGGLIDLHFHLVPKTRVDTITFKGNRSLTEKQLKYVVRMRRNADLITEDVERDVERIKTAYRRKGHMEAQVEYEIGGNRDYQKDVLFRISEGPQISISAVVLNGRSFYKREKLLRKLGIYRGVPLDLDRLEEGIERLRLYYRENGFDEVRITLLDQDPEKWQDSELFTKGVVRINVDCGRRVKLLMSGNESYSARRLFEAISVRKGDLFSYSYSTMLKMKSNLRNYYQRRGYLNVQVGSRIETVGKWDKNVWFYVREGKRVKIDRLLFEGNEHFRDKELSEEIFAWVRGLLSTGTEGELHTPDVNQWETRTAAVQWQHDAYTRQHVGQYENPEELDADEVFLPEVYREASGLLRDFYLEHGYLSVVVDEAKVSFSSTGQRVKVHFNIKEGVQTLIDTVAVVNNTLRSRDEIIKLCGFYYDRPLNPLALDDLERKIHDSYASAGYIYSTADISYTLSQDGTRASLIVGIYEGPQVRIGEILIKGNDVTKPETVRWELTFDEGDVYTPKDMEDSQSWLQKLGIFQSVTLQPWDPEKEEDVKKLLVTVIERDQGRFGVSLGIASDDGVRGSAEFAYNNIGGYALEFHTRLKANHRIPAILDEEFRELYMELEPLESLEREVTVGFNYPSIIGSHIALRFDLVHLRRQERLFGLDKNSVIITFSTELWRYLRLAQINEIAWQYSNHTLLDPLEPYAIVPPAGQSIEYSPKLQLTFDYRDSLFNPTWGIVLSAMEEYFQTLSGDIRSDLFRTSGSAAGYIPIPITPRRTAVLRLMGKGGIIHNIGGSDTPVDKLFKLGGRNTVRGFIEEGIYPGDLSSVERVAINLSHNPSPGGDLYLLLKTDLRFPLYKTFFLGAFIDTGNLWRDPDSVNLDLTEYKSGAGGGLHYRTPVGDLSLELGWNLKPDRTLHEESYRVHFSISLF